MRSRLRHRPQKADDLRRQGNPMWFAPRPAVFQTMEGYDPDLTGKVDLVPCSPDHFSSSQCCQQGQFEGSGGYSLTGTNPLQELCGSFVIQGCLSPAGQFGRALEAPIS